jgi:hypothetical protein
MGGTSMASISVAVIFLSAILVLFLDWILIRWFGKIELRRKITNAIGKGVE